MGKSAPVLLLQDTTRFVPGAIIGAFGLGAAFFTYEAMRMSSLRSVEVANGFSGMSSAATVLVLLLFAFIYHARPSFRLHRHPAIGFLIACVSAFSMVVLYEGGFWPTTEALAMVARVLNGIAQVLILICWTEFLIPLKARHTATLIALGFMTLGLFSTSAACLRDYTACVIVATAPILSIVCLYWFRDMRNSLDELVPKREVNAFAMFQIDDSLTNSQVVGKAKSAPFLFFVPLACFSFIFGNVHYSWIPHQDGAFMSFAVQIAAGLGTALGGVALLLLITYLWGRRRIEIYMLFALPVLMLALYMTTFVSNDFAFLYVVPLNVAQKTVFFVIWMVPYLSVTKTSPLEPFCFALCSYQLGKLFSALMSGLSADLSYSIGITLAICLLALSLVTGVVLDRKKIIPDKHDEHGEAGESAELAEAGEGVKGDNYDKGGNYDESAKYAESGESTMHDENGKIHTRAALGFDTCSTPQVKQQANDQTRAAYAGYVNYANQSLRSGEAAGINEAYTPEENKSTSSMLADVSVARCSNNLSRGANDTRAVLIAKCGQVARAHQLTRREEEVLQLLAEGMTAPAIAQTLVVSTSTAKSHLRNIYAKLGVHSQNELMLLVLDSTVFPNE